jgi:N6-L-threonylcarbamoyladenine synthase
VTSEPGLIGSLLVGVVTAKSLAMAKQLPLIGVNHIEGHLFAGFAKDDKYTPPEGFETPFLALAVSGGHTSLVEVKALGDYKLLGATADDAAGEALDKFAKLIGLGFPGGAQVDQWARKGDPTKYPFPLAREHDETLQMSFSGLKSSAVRFLNTLSAENIQAHRADLCASFQHAVVESLILKLQAALKQTGLKRLVVTGGVSANSELRARAEKLCADQSVQLMMPPLRYCTDNAAMIGVVGMRRLLRGDRSDMSLSPSPLSHLELTAYVST